MTQCVGIIGGTGLEDPRLFTPEREWTPQTPWGMPSSPLLQGRLEGVRVVLLSRHGREHRIPPGQVNNRANIAALQEAGCTQILATAACGSLRAEFRPGQLLIPDQCVDFTRQRAVSLIKAFPAGSGFPASATRGMRGEIFAPVLRAALLQAGEELGVPVRDGGVILTIEGPRFSTRAESRMFRGWGADLINMTIAPEAALAFEAGLAYAVVAMATDFDSWNEDEPPLRVSDLLAVFHRNVDNLTRLLRTALKRIPE